EIACSRGILCVTSAGNDGGTSFPYISAPADGEQVLTIGAVGTNGVRANFSSVGPTYDGRIKPDLMALGQGAAVVMAGEGEYYNNGNGTSFACPVLAGMAACLWQANRCSTAAEIRDALRESGNMTSPNNNYGYGIPNFMMALDYLFWKNNSDFVINSALSVFPNPSNGNVKVLLKIEGNAEVKVYNQIGKLLYYNNINTYNSNGLDEFLSNVDSGVYIINLMCYEKNIITKFIKY
ncbi:MAG: S8 family peptidase, partial [Methanobrevibacter sp.]|nr:S8 family peptidase [Methanobrevibacter sp.]